MRCLTGIGEAAFVCLAPALIDDVAPRTQRTRWLAVFFSMLPIGYALGYLGAGLIAAYSRWEVVFLSESLLTLPLACLCLFLPNVKADKGTGHGPSIVASAAAGASKPESIGARVAAAGAAEEARAAAVPPKPLSQSLRLLLRNPTYVLLTLGYCAQTFVIGALTFWVRSPAQKHSVHVCSLSVCVSVSVCQCISLCVRVRAG
jgi:MFS family permease